MRITVSQAQRGTAVEWADREYRQLAVAVTNARNIADDYLLGMMRAQMGATLSPKVAKTWRRYRYPSKGVSANAATSIVTKVPWIVEAFSRPAVITPKKGKFLAIPTENAPKRGRDGKRAMPSNWPVDRMGPLRVVKTRRGLALVVDNVKASYSRKTGAFRRFQLPGARTRGAAERRGESFQSSVMFWLRPIARMKKRLTPNEHHRRATFIFFRAIEIYLAGRDAPQ